MRRLVEARKPRVRLSGFLTGSPSLSQILEEYPTPLYLYSGEIIREKYRRLHEAFPQFEIFHSLKANPNPALAGLLRRLGARAEVSSLGEMRTALRTGHKPRNIIFVGPAKTRPDIAFAVRQNVYAIVAESTQELHYIEEAAANAGRAVNVLLRINTREHAKSAAERMVGGPSKFGFDEENVVEQVRQSKIQNPKSKVVLAGIQVYSASGVLDAGFICQHLDIVLGLALRLSRELRFPLRCIDFGGGFGVPYEGDDKELDLRRISRHAAKLLIQNPKPKTQNPLLGCRFIIEIGRYLLAESGVYVTKVLRVKESRGECFAICDGGMNHFTRHAFMKTNHQIRVLSKQSSTSGNPKSKIQNPKSVEEGASPIREYHICGPLCTPLDELGRCALPPIDEGDIIGVFDAGAYGYTMSLGNFLSFGWPAEVLVDRSRTSLIRPAQKP